MITHIAKSLAIALHQQVAAEEIETLLEKPKNRALGDFALPCFKLSKQLGKSPQTITTEIQKNVTCELIQSIELVGGYVNLFLNQHLITQQVLSKVMKEQKLYGTSPISKGSAVFDFSSPNIAKPFSMGHLRSTVIGNALANLAEKNGYKAICINHLGDWGTQFGKLIVAYHLWGNQQAIEAAPIKELLKIYVKFHEEAQQDATLIVQARAAFKALEEQDEQALALWQWFREVSLEEFKGLYQLLGIQFDRYEGEAFYNDKMPAVVSELQTKELLTLSEGAYVVELEDMPPCIIMKTDGATLYATRDLAAAFYRKQQYNPEKIYYVVGNEQTLHFQQLFHVIEKMGYDWAQDLRHVAFGMILQDGKKMSTRKGKIVLLHDVLTEAIETAKQSIQLKNPHLQNKEEVARQVGVGAVIFNDLKNNRIHDIEFSINDMMQFEGETGPYIQYTHARIHSILDKADGPLEEVSFQPLGQQAWQVLLLLEQFPRVITNAYEQVDPSIVAKYALQLARAFNKYYATNKILTKDRLQSCRLTLCQGVAIILNEALALLGIEAPKNM
ncbi:arginine--tRNA ligase [Lysinibacillus sp. FSL M8-0337]|uniref:arginine--tRNA ligase n=1 Tax=Lysinibacillus TaxID=400634 RepID=UPI00084A5052|nr:arginine--tRNA ligase [Lysinibacillus sphaericus]